MAGSVSDYTYATEKAKLLNSQPNYTGYNPSGVAQGSWTANDVLGAFNSAGLTPEQHYNQYGQSEGLSYDSTPTNPNELYNNNTYLYDKAALLNTDANYAGYNPYNVQSGAWSPEDVGMAFNSAGLTPEQHYNQYGQSEGLYYGSDRPRGWSVDGNDYGTVSSAGGGGGGGYNNNTRASIPGNTVTVPDYAINNQMQMSAKIPEYFDSLMGMGLENYGNAYGKLAALPGQIDDWTAESLKRQRVTGDQATGVFNQVANQRAGGGIQGGTEAQNLEANAQANLSQIILENQNNIQNQANQLKAGTIQNMPSVASMPISNALSLYGTSANEALSWGNMAMNTLLSSY